MDRRLYAVVSKVDDGRKMKDFLRAKWHLSAALLTELKRRETGILRNGIRATARDLLRTGDQICLSVGDEGADSGFEERNMDLEILYEDSDYIVLNKPPFLPVHPSKGHVDDTLANGLTYYYHQKGETFVSRCVLRLDGNTSGAVLFAKNAYAHDALRRQLADGTLKKEYYALVHGVPPLRGTVDAPVYRPQEATVRRVVDPRGKEAVTDYITEKSNGSLSLLRVLPKTGRTHQIRLHLSHIGHPLVSDFLYGREDDGILTRHGLHCSKITFRHPVTGKEICVKAPLSSDMAGIADRLSPCERYRSLDSHLKEVFGEKLAKLPLNGGFSCPNRKDGGRGCSFCSAGGSGEFAPKPRLSVSEQLQAGKEPLRRKWPKCRFIAYFQAYTNTYAPISELRQKFLQAMADEEVAVLSIATRPDCLPEEVLDLLAELNRIKPVWVELGLQTAKDATAEAFHRGYPRSVYEDAAAALRNRGISVITHLIFGLPGETREEMLESVRYAARFSDGIKLQMLQILKGSLWGDTYAAEPFQLLSRGEYVSLVCDAIAILPERITVHRLTGDPPKDLLLAPRWTADKKRVLADLRVELERRDLVQGCNSK